MKTIKPSFEIVGLDNGQELIKRIEAAGRTCYKSESRITEDSAEKFVRSIIKRGHESVLEHEKVTVRIVCDRGISHEIVRHRLASYSQESTRYVNYGGDDIEFIEPLFYDDETRAGERAVWVAAMAIAEYNYKCLLLRGSKPGEARTVLPNSLKTEIVMTANIREWRHFFKLRTSKAAHPQMREISIPMLAEFKLEMPVLFEDIEVGE